MLVLLVFAAAVLQSQAFVVDIFSLGEHTNPFLIAMCEPIQSTAHATVRCTYTRQHLVCTAMCAAGYAFSFGDTMATTSCDASGRWSDGRNVPACLPTINPGKPTKAPAVTGACVHGLSECPGTGMFHACNSCSQFVHCADDGAFLVDCPALTYFDASTNRCETTSSTCS